MMISDLPHHLLEEILSRVPATTLKRLQPTCKQWNALLKDQIFTEKHHRKAPKQPLLLMLKEFRVCPVSVEINLSVTAPSIEFKDPFDIKGSPSSSQQVNIVEVIHCEGLLLCITEYNKLVVWNPFLGETKWIQASSHYKKKSSFALGYKKNKSCRDYKILRYWQSCKSEDQVVEFEIYELSSDSWRFLDGISLDYYIHASGWVSLQGNTYWVGSERKDKDSSIFLLSFDFTTERFRRLNLPPVLPTMKLSLFREEQISGLHMNYFPLKMDLWVTTNFGTEAAALSWSKSFTVDLHVLEERYPMFTTFLLDEDKKVVVCPGLVGRDTKNVVYIIGEDNEYHTEIPYVRSTQKPWWPRIFNYVPSLVQIQQRTQQTRKRRMEQENVMLVKKKRDFILPEEKKTQ
ncbi:putative F-box/kelch-repeat protein At3g22730 [Brassica rapa]|uniref:F-box domain-containing protein n=1 Tax=Brassica campestris TaxID=3711 RepID=M4EHQ4_BRACM|nr:putative F-box/kelch-repeat protein At3g22730 [Brassica rapa]